MFSLLALAFMGLLTGLTCSVHFVILTVSHQAEFAGQSWLPLILSFKWLSVTYALDILAWDVFFALAVLSAAPVFSGSRLARSIRLSDDYQRCPGSGRTQWSDPRRRAIPQYRNRRLRRRASVAALLLTILFYRARSQEAWKTQPGLSHGDDKAPSTKRAREKS